MTKGFASCHPVINFLFYVGAVGMSMFLSHPLFAACSLLLALSEYLLLSRGKNRKILLWYILMLLLILLCNGLLNTLGETVLLRWIYDRPITMEALVYGAVVGMNFVSVMLWFSCYNIVMTTDKFTALFGRFTPSITLVLTMILRLIPLLQKKTQSIVSARNCIGKCKQGDNAKENLQSGMKVLSILTSCALEDAVITADSMRSRGYVDKNHSTYMQYRWSRRDLVLGALFFLCASAVLFVVASGETSMQYFPTIHFPENPQLITLGLTAYGLFLALPILIELWEEFTWHILKSNI